MIRLGMALQSILQAGAIRQIFNYADAALKHTKIALR
jgi:hypothetical protein